MPNVSTFIEGKMTITHRDGSWTEKYALGNVGYTNAEAQMQQLISRRAWLLATGFTIVKAVISDKATKGDGLRVNMASVYNTGQGFADNAGPPNPAYCDDVYAGLLVNFMDGQGNSVKRLFRGIPDFWVADDLLTLTLPVPIGSPSPPAIQTPNYYPQGGPYSTFTPVNLNTSATLINGFLSMFRDLTYLYKPSGVSLMPYKQIAFTVAAGGNWFFERISSRTVGLRYEYSKGKRPAFA